jgi:hypothetical protein
VVVVVVVVEGLWGCALANVSGESGLGRKAPKPSRSARDSSAPRETTAGTRGGRWRAGADEAVVVLGRRIRKHEAGSKAEHECTRG